MQKEFDEQHSLAKARVPVHTPWPLEYSVCYAGFDAVWLCGNVVCGMLHAACCTGCGMLYAACCTGCGMLHAVHLCRPDLSIAAHSSAWRSSFFCAFDTSTCIPVGACSNFTIGTLRASAACSERRQQAAKRIPGGYPVRSPHCRLPPQQVHSTTQGTDPQCCSQVQHSRHCANPVCSRLCGPKCQGTAE